MNLFGLGRRASTHVMPEDFVPGPRELWIENAGEAGMRILLEPWSDTIEVPAGHFARFNAQVGDDRDEFVVRYGADAALSIQCPPKTTIAVFDKRL